MSTYYVYILSCSDKTLYTGLTNNPSRRLREHAEGKGARYTRARLPVQLRYLQSVSGRSEALRREWEIKRMSRRAKLVLCARYMRSPKHSVR